MNPARQQRSRTHVVMSTELTKRIDGIVGKRKRSSFIVDAVERELMRLNQLRALQIAAGSWKDEDHPELAHGAAAHIRKLRRDGERQRRASISRA